jgi:hypothetical protein
MADQKAPEVKAGEEPKFVKVVSALPDNGDGSSPIAFNEVDARHPNGQAFVSSQTVPVEVFKTEAVEVAVVQGKIKAVK